MNDFANVSEPNLHVIHNTNQHRLSTDMKEVIYYFQCIRLAFQQVKTFLGSDLLALEGLQVHACRGNLYWREIRQIREKTANNFKKHTSAILCCCIGLR